MKLRDYQYVGRDFLLDRTSAALFLDMGLGKTAIALCALQDRHLPVLVIAPKRVAEEVWPAEIEEWRGDLTYAVATGTAEQRRAALESGADIVVISRDNVALRAKADPRSLVEGHAGRFAHVIIDELSSFKSQSSARFKAMRRFLRVGSPGVWGLTGTPMPNGLLDLWPQIYLLDGGERLGRTVTSYRERYFRPGRQLRTGVITEWIPRPGVESVIHTKLEDLALSMSTDGRVKLPDVVVNQVAVPLPPAAQRAYNAMKRDFIADLSAAGGELHSSESAVIASNRLAQITAGFLYADDLSGRYDRIHSAKIDVVEELVEASLGSPVLVFYQYLAELDALKERFPGAGTTDQRGFSQRWNNGEIPVLLAHPASAGHGLNLQHGGHTVIWTSPSWSLEEDQQANKRLYRSGQKHTVTINYLVSPGTIDIAKLARVRDKRSAQQALLDYLEGRL